MSLEIRTTKSIFSEYSGLLFISACLERVTSGGQARPTATHLRGSFQSPNHPLYPFWTESNFFRF